MHDRFGADDERTPVVHAARGRAFFEAPRWHDGRWWVSDFYRDRVIAVEPAGRGGGHAVAGRPSGLGWLPDGSLLVVSMRDRRSCGARPRRGRACTPTSASCAAGHLNDMVVDRHGRAYAGEFGFDLDGGADPAPAVLVRVDPDGTASVAAEDLLFPNGSVITPDGRTLIVGETAGCALHRLHDRGRRLAQRPARCGRRSPRRRR